MSIKPWLETWKRDPESPDCVLVMRSEKVAEFGMGRFHADGNTDAEAATRAQLIAAAPALVRALLAVEWTEQVREGGACWRECPGCRSDKRQLTKDGRGHAADCPIDAALTAADLPTQKERDEARAEMMKEPT